MENHVVIVVDDKIKPLDWSIEVMRRCGIANDNIITARYGDEALRKYTATRDAGNIVDLVLSDFHMNVRKKPPQGLSGTFRNAAILSGIELADAIFGLNPSQKFCLLSRGMNSSITVEADQHGIQLALYKHRPHDSQFPAYVEKISAYLSNQGLHAAV